jgi:hypothetical protein
LKSSTFEYYLADPPVSVTNQKCLLMTYEKALIAQSRTGEIPPID